MRARIWQEKTNKHVYAQYYDVHIQNHVLREFFVSPGPIGPVQEATRTGPSSVCRRLASMGETINAQQETLLKTIRTEYRRMRAQERADLK
jgi:hypothetical protein